MRGDGLFHVESEASNHIEVSEGTLNDIDLAGLKNDLANKDLAALKQQTIPLPLAMTERDEFVISILRSPLTQNLTFLDRESRRPFGDFIDPLLHWLEALRQHPHVTLSELAGRNNCMPPRKIEFSPRRTPGPTESPANSVTSASEKDDSTAGAPEKDSEASQHKSFLMRWEFNHIANSVVENTCVIVYRSGRYRMERSTQEAYGKLKLHAFEDALDDNDLHQLGALLDEPELKSSTHRNLPNGQVFREGEITTLEISRDRQMQELVFANYFAVPGWVSNVSASTDPEERIVKPLRKWLKNHVQSREMTPLQNPVSTRCVAQPVVQTEQKRP